MTRIYLDVHDRVRIDTTAGHRQAARAKIDRSALKFLRGAEGLAERLLQHDLEHGNDTGSSLDLLGKCLSLRLGVLEKAG